MNVFNSITLYNKIKPSVVTIGTFDGVHLGHKAILTQLVAAAEKENLESILLTFFPHPRMVLQKESSVKLINTINERQDILKSIWDFKFNHTSIYKRILTTNGNGIC